MCKGIINSRLIKPTVYFLLIYFCLTAAYAGARTALSDFDQVSQYISSQWSTLTRDLSKCEAYNESVNQKEKVVYFPINVNPPENIKSPNCHVQMIHFPKAIVKMARTKQVFKYRGELLYLPHPYVVPGGRFNEMYGWDSYFIIRGLLEDGQLELAKNMIENFFFEIDHYGSILNANRAYYLSRSQPPFLSSMILSVYNAMKAKGQTDLLWLEKAYNYAIKDYKFWISPPHLAGKTGLSRYYDFNDGPVAELNDSFNFYYRDATKYFLLHPDEAKDYLARFGEPDLIGDIFSIKICPPQGQNTLCNKIEYAGLTKNFYRGDRAMRESGLDITFRFGPFGAGTIDYAPLDLNSLLYKTEMDLEIMSKELGKKWASQFWHRRALERQEKMNRYFWNQKQGLFFDFNFIKNEQSNYQYITTFYPLWAGLATKEQARAVRNNLILFEQKGGLAASTYETGAQWDYPYGWAPFQLIAIEGLRRYGYADDADRLSLLFLTTVLKNFRHDGTLREKYNVVRSTSETNIRIGYLTNEIGFGWTNGVFLCLLHDLVKNKESLKNADLF